MIWNLELKLPVDGQIHQPGKIAIEAKLSEIVRKLPDNDITIETDDQYKATITCEKACFFRLWDKKVKNFLLYQRLKKITRL